MSKFKIHKFNNSNLCKMKEIKKKINFNKKYTNKREKMMKIELKK